MSEPYEPLNPHPTTQRDLDLRLVALAAVAYLAHRDGASRAASYDEQIDPTELAHALDRLAGAE